MHAAIPLCSGLKLSKTCSFLCCEETKNITMVFIEYVRLFTFYKKNIKNKHNMSKIPEINKINKRYKGILLLTKRLKNSSQFLNSSIDTITAH